jgi:hypothetical protein
MGIREPANQGCAPLFRSEGTAFASSDSYLYEYASTNLYDHASIKQPILSSKLPSSAVQGSFQSDISTLPRNSPPLPLFFTRLLNERTLIDCGEISGELDVRPKKVLASVK